MSDPITPNPSGAPPGGNTPADTASPGGTANPPAGSAATSPTGSATTSDPPAFGWSAYAERVNGRFAMLGFAAVLLIEALSHDTFLHWAGLVP
jgi:hypothetical protein